MGVQTRVTVREGLRAFGLGLVPCLALSCVLLLVGWASIDPVAIPEGEPSPPHLHHRAAQLRGYLPAGFHVEIADPFVVVVEGSPDRAAEVASDVREVVDELRASIFERDPHTVTDIWVFADTVSFRKGTREMLDDWPRTLSGYYSPSRRAVIVNAASGSTTLRHEVVHPFLAANYPDLPAWVDEGIAAMFERTRPTSAGLAFLPGKRLPRLQEAIRKRKLPSLAAFTAGTDRDFYGDPRYLSYAQARYLMLFLEANGHLERFLWRLEHNGEYDPTGFATVLDLTESQTFNTLQLRWESYVLGLSSPAR